ncbi:MAG: DEAD/DEAH box helicase [Deltaproteobacteria bacterium]|jgi:ATP-dependent RNA helicase DeaD|nr:DEAD/DEAH box helicase [Deltaproteobacteria bacterium]
MSEKTPEIGAEITPGAIHFEDLGLSKELLKGVTDLGFEEPSPIQAQAIPFILAGRDVVGQAQTGTGKTAAFGLPILELINLRSKKVQALVLCPTRELAVQVAEEVTSLATHLRGISVLPVYGGQSLERQIRVLERGVQFVVGTPGRVLDHLERGTLKLDNLQTLVLDEADEMLDMGFRDDIQSVLDKAPEDCRRVCFSATMPKAILALIKSYMKDPEFITVTRKEVTVPNVEQIYYDVRQHRKSDSLCLVLDTQDFNKGIVFCSTKLGVDELTTHLLAHGYQADALHGNLSQGQRDRVMSRFRTGGLDLLVATDVAARGLDIDDVDLVINYDMPFDVESYVHRIGRTGRAGRAGRAVTFVTPREAYKIREISRYTKADIKRAQLPNKREVSDLKTGKLLGEVMATMEDMREARKDSKKLDRYTLLLQSLTDDESGEVDIAAALLKMLIEREKIWPSPEELEAERREQEEMRAWQERSRQDRGGFGGNSRGEGRNWRDRSERGYSAGSERGRDGQGRYGQERDGAESGQRRGGAEGQRGGQKRGQQRDMQRLFFNVGSKARVTPGDFVGAITGESGLPGRVVGEIEIHDRFTFVDVPREYAEEIMRVMNKAQIRGMRVAVDVAKPME